MNNIGHVVIQDIYSRVIARLSLENEYRKEWQTVPSLMHVYLYRDLFMEEMK